MTPATVGAALGALLGASALVACAETAAPPPALELAPAAGAAPLGRFPRLAPSNEADPDAGHAALVVFTAGDAARATLFAAQRDGNGWNEPEVVAEGAGWFVNWADCPALARDPNGARLATWLVKNGGSPYAYEVRFATSSPGEEGWSEPGVLHDDRSEAEHGFVSLVALDAGWCAVWLDGRHTGGGGHGAADVDGHAGGAMALVTRTVGAGGGLGPEATLDERVCDCCPTDAARLADGTVVVVYRDRGPDERRDIGIVRGRPEDPSSWSAPRPVHDDGWILAGCPVNGPAVAAAGVRVGTAWFTLGSEGRPRVLATLSEDGGATFGAPLTIDAGDPLGRVDAAFVPGGPLGDVLLVTWLEATSDGAEWCARSVSFAAPEPLGPVLVVASAPAGREAGALRIARSGIGAEAVWTDARGEPSRILAGRLGLRSP